MCSPNRIPSILVDDSLDCLSLAQRPGQHPSKVNEEISTLLDIGDFEDPLLGFESTCVADLASALSVEWRAIEDDPEKVSRSVG